MDDSPADPAPVRGTRGPVRWWGRLRNEVGVLAELLALTWLAAAQPVLSVYAQAPEQFVLQRADGGEIVLFAVAITVGPALGLWALTMVALPLPRVRRWVVVALGAGLVGVAGAGLAKELLGPGMLRVGVPAATATVAWMLVRGRWDVVARTARTLAVAPVLSLGLFVFASPVHAVVTAGDVDALGVEVERPAPIVFLLFDELPTASLLDGEGAIDGSLLPGFAALAGDATWYRNHTTMAPYTEAAVPAILTGMAPELPRRPPVAEEHPQNLFSLLDGTYDLSVQESPVTFLCQSPSCTSSTKAPTATTVRTLLEEAHTVWRSIISPTAPASTLDFNVQDMPEDLDALPSMEAFIDGIEPSERPRLHFLHVLLPHQPWHLLPDGRQYAAPSPPMGLSFFLWDDAGSAERGRQRHLLQLQAADRVLLDLVTRLQDQGTYDDALIVVTADHGVSFEVGQPERGASGGNLHEVVWTPLLIKAPGSDGGGEVVDDPARTIDILPTMAAILGFDAPEPFDGISLRDGGSTNDEVALLDWELSDDAIDDEDDDYVRFDGRPWFERLLATPRVPLADDPALRLFRTGPHPELIGTSVRDSTIGERAAVTFELRAPARGELDDDPDPDDLPLYVDGMVSAEQELPVAFALNGRIAVIAEPRTEFLGDGHVWGLLPPSLLLDGEDDELEVFLIEVDGDEVLLRPMATTFGSLPAIADP